MLPLVEWAEKNSSPVLVLSQDGRLLSANKASWLILKVWKSAVGDVVPPQWLEIARTAISERQNVECTLAVGFAAVRLLFVPDGNSGKLYIFGADVTRERQIRKDLMIKAHVQAQAHEAIVVTDEEFRTLDINPAYTQLTGYEEADVLGEYPSFLKTLMQDEDMYAEVVEALLASGSWHGELWDRTSRGKGFAARVSLSAVSFESASVTHYVALITDITIQKSTQEQLYRMAHYDGLTGLPNRYLFADFVYNTISHSRRTGTQFALMVVDLDGFKSVNDTLGHRAGDKLLQILSGRMSQVVRKSDLVARFGGDEFAVLVRDLDSVDAAIIIAKKLLQTISQTSSIDGHEVFVTASIGVAMFPRDQTAIEPLLRKADTAMYRIKRRGKNDVRFFSEDPETESEIGAPIQAALRRAIDEDQITVCYQPQVDVFTGALTGMEALARWNNGPSGAISPDVFIPVAEQYGLISGLGEKVLRTAARQSVIWERQFGKMPGMSVNVSVRQLTQKGFTELVKQVLEEEGLSGDRLELELTETLFIEDKDEILPVLRSLADLGVRLAIDDFGTRYASLLYLKRFPVHRLKIDQQFVKDVPWEQSAAHIITAIIALADRIGCEVIAEGVETMDQLEFLREAGCPQIQGYLSGPPLEAGELKGVLRAGAGQFAELLDHSNMKAVST